MPPRPSPSTGSGVGCPSRPGACCAAAPSGPTGLTWCRCTSTPKVRADIADPKGHSPRAEAAVRKILGAGALPIVIGGDHAVPIPVLRAMDGEGPITLIQIDQHNDWRDDVNGVRDGLSSPIRRASEMAHIGEIFQIGLRATGSARSEEVAAARAYGAHLISAYELHDHGMEAVLERIPDGGRYYLTVDLDVVIQRPCKRRRLSPKFS